MTSHLHDWDTPDILMKSDVQMIPTLTFFKTHQQINSSSLDGLLKNYIIITMDEYKNKEYRSKRWTGEKGIENSGKEINLVYKGVVFYDLHIKNVP